VIATTQTLPLRLVLLREIPENDNLRREWNDLVLRVQHPQVFYTYEWALSVHRAYKETLTPLLFLGYEGGQLSGVAPLAVGAGGSEVSFLCATTGDYCDFIASQEHIGSFISLVLAELKTLGFARTSLANLPADSLSVATLRETSSSIGFRLFARTAYDCAQVSFKNSPGQDRKPVIRRERTIRRYLNAMSREAPLRLEHERSWNAIAAALPGFIEAHVARFLATGRISNLASRQRRVFLEELAKRLSECGWLNLTRMVKGATTIAWNYGFRFQGTWFWYQPTFSMDMEKYSPGMCLLAKILDEAADDPAITTVDLGLGAEAYKQAFANQSRRTLYITLRTSPVQHAREIGRYYAASVIKASPWAESKTRAALAHWQSLADRAHRAGLVPTLAWSAKRACDFLVANEEVHFFEGNEEATTNVTHTRLVPLDLKGLAAATAQYADDASTCAYLLRAAQLARKSGIEGFALVDDTETFLHFAWITAFDGFYLSELNDRVQAPSPECVMIFDCWTPPAVRGQGHYGEAVALIADLLRNRGKKPWIFSAATNTPSLRGLEKAGFQRRYSLVRRRVLGWQKIKSRILTATETVPEEVSTHS